jgi:hypothetical protein
MIAKGCGSGSETRPEAIMAKLLKVASSWSANRAERVILLWRHGFKHVKQLVAAEHLNELHSFATVCLGDTPLPFMPMVRRALRTWAAHFVGRWVESPNMPCESCGRGTGSWCDECDMSDHAICAACNDAVMYCSNCCPDYKGQILHRD